MAALLLVLFVLTSASASAQKVDVVSMGSADFEGYESFSFQPFRVLADDGPWRNGVVERLVKDAIGSELGEKGVRQVEESPDLHIAVYLGLEQDMWVDSFNQWSPRKARQRGTGISLNQALAKPKTYYSRKGIGVIDLIDVKTDTVVWRAYCSVKVSGSDDREKKIYKAVTKAFKKYPPK